jgi:hypothetical protein
MIADFRHLLFSLFTAGHQWLCACEWPAGYFQYHHILCHLQGSKDEEAVVGAHVLLVFFIDVNKLSPVDSDVPYAGNVFFRGCKDISSFL